MNNFEDVISDIKSDNSETNQNGTLPKRVPIDVSVMKRPPGRTNYTRLLNTNTYYLLTHIQESLSLNNKCIIELIKNYDHPCINTNPTIQRRIRLFAEDNMGDDYPEKHPRSKIRIKIGETADGDGVYNYRDETDEEWHYRLCHMYMHEFHPNKLQMIKCEECIHEWMNSKIW